MGKKKLKLMLLGAMDKLEQIKMLTQVEKKQVIRIKCRNSDM